MISNEVKKSMKPKLLLYLVLFVVQSGIHKCNVNGCHRSRKYYDVVILLTLISTTFTPIFSIKMEDTLGHNNKKYDTNANVNGCHRPLNFLLEKAVVLTSPKG